VYTFSKDLMLDTEMLDENASLEVSPPLVVNAGVELDCSLPGPLVAGRRRGPVASSP
jgi:hypothetical protein